MVDGYLTNINTSTDTDRKKLLNAFVKVCKFYAPGYFKKKITSWNSQYFHNSLITLRKKNPIIFSAIYDSMLNSNSLNKFIFSSKFEQLAKKILKGATDEYYMHGLMLRMDCPDDDRNSYGWHQDCAYDKLSISGMSGCVLWSPLINTNKENGSILIMPKSQREHYDNVNNNISSIKTKKFFSKQLLLNSNVIKKYKEKQIPIKAGNTLSFYSGLFHKSGKNKSKKIRFTVLVRYNHINSKDFRLYNKSQS